MAYNLIFQQPAKGFEYMKAIDELGQAQNLFPYLSYSFKDRFINNINNMDSLKAFSDEVYELSMFNLYETKRYSTYAMITLGSVVESLYVILYSYNKDKPNEALMKRIAEQESMIYQLEEMINSYLDPRTSKNLLKDVEPLISAYRGLVGEKGATKVIPKYDRIV